MPKKKAVPTSDVCEIRFVNESRVKSVQRSMKSGRVIWLLSELFGVISDPTRVKLVYALSKAELCVCDLSALLGISPSAISHQLRILRNHRIVKFRRAGKLAYYTLDDNHVERLLKDGLRHAEAKC